MSLVFAVKDGDEIILQAHAIDVIGVRLTLNLVDKTSLRYTVPVEAVSTNDRVGVAARIRISSDGSLESAGVTIISGTTPSQAGELYLQGFITRASLDIGQFLAGYFYGGHAPSYPGPKEGPQEGTGRVRMEATDNPAANAEIAAEAVPTGARWRVRSFQIQMVQGATQTPRPALAFRNASAALVALIPLNADVAASTTVDCHWGLGLSNTENNVTGGSMTAPLPDMLLPAAFDVITSTQGIGAASDYGAGILEIEEWIVI